MVIYGKYALVHVYIAREHHHFSWETQYFDWAMFNRYVTNYQRGSSFNKFCICGF